MARTTNQPDPDTGPALADCKVDDVRTQRPDLVLAFETPFDEVLAGATETELRAHCAGLVAAIETSAATAERDRILGIEASALPGHDDLVAKLKADGKTSPAEAAQQVIAAEKQTGARQIQARQEAEAGLDKPAPSTGAEPGPEKPKGEDKSLPVDERCKAAWAANADLRAEYGDSDDGYARYAALRKAEEKGQVRILGGRRA